MEVESRNFGFLKQHDPLLVVYAARAEVYVFDDPNTSLVKMRQVIPDGVLAAADLLAVLLGIPEEIPSGEGALVRGSRIELKLPSGDGRAVLVSTPGGVTGLSLPGGVRVELTPGAGVPRRIELKGPEGRALLSLESYGGWPEGEEVPKG